MRYFCYTLSTFWGFSKCQLEFRWGRESTFCWITDTVELRPLQRGEGAFQVSLIPRHLRKGRRNAWYTLFAHALISKPISKNLWAIGYSGNLPCNSDVTSLKFLLPQVAFFFITTFRSEVQPSPMQSPTLSNSCKCLMSVLNPSSDRLWRPYMTGTMFSCGYLLGIR